MPYLLRTEASFHGKYVRYTPETLDANGRVTGEANEECTGSGSICALLPGPHAKLAGPTFGEWLTTQPTNGSAA